ncbi:hypothetical protein [Spiroplasma endosymbiont of Polydrusus pterygomalis]|uniref:hypothetical protein n=1 Tax=Spiroplasma endosymbiont of Polydrusus pterygomalis TaxID=3139327 RepID=UPI003CCB5D95
MKKKMLKLIKNINLIRFVSYDTSQLSVSTLESDYSMQQKYWWKLRKGMGIKVKNTNAHKSTNECLFLFSDRAKVRI